MIEPRQRFAEIIMHEEAEPAGDADAEPDFFMRRVDGAEQIKRSRARLEVPLHGSQSRRLIMRQGASLLMSGKADGQTAHSAEDQRDAERILGEIEVAAAQE